MLTHSELIDLIIEEGKHTFISTGMHTMDEIGSVVEKFKQKNVHLNWCILWVLTQWKMKM